MKKKEENLFANAAAPLAARLRPEDWNFFEGQKDVVRQLKSARLHSMILYGPPGCGKTTLARILARNSGLVFEEISAVSSGIKEVREAIDEARKTGQRVLFIDEIHRFSKAQQDALLEAVESGIIILIGATTENPSFEVIGPLLSRCFVYRLKSLGEKELTVILDRALENAPGASFTEGARSMLIERAGGDARKMLSVIDLAMSGINGRAIKEEDLSEILQVALRRYDKSGENHFDFISAFIKSLRGSDPDAAVLYLACMLEGGEDPLFIARRMVIFASEDVGNASVQALGLAVAAFQAVERIGMPEGRIILSHAATFLASCPKSNASYLAIGRALEEVQGRQIVIPDHLRNAPTKTHRAEGAAKGYKYPHDFPGHYVDQNYMPPGFEEAQFYHPTEQGQEGRLLERLKSLGRKRKYDKS